MINGLLKTIPFIEKGAKVVVGLGVAVTAVAATSKVTEYVNSQNAEYIGKMAKNATKAISKVAKKENLEVAEKAIKTATKVAKTA
jgi:prefoldin subunit 5